MNDPSKAIGVSLSSLMSLKAELMRKQVEVNKAKARNSLTDEYTAHKTSSNDSTNNNITCKGKDKEKTIKRVSANNEATIYEHEDSALLKKSQRVLEAKSKFYDRMSRAGGKLNSDDNCLVLFNRKRQEQADLNCNELQSKASPSEDSSSCSSDEAADDPEEDWVEYTDCLGRTRKCLRKDLADVRRRDTELANSMPERLDQSKANWMIDTKGSYAPEEKKEVNEKLPSESIYSEGCSQMSKHEEQRANWELKERENLDKKDVHYQDVFFDEARQHGVGYYAFSTDEEERKRQQQELEETRKRTLNEQENRERLRTRREKIMADRVRAAKNRQRARFGLPPLERTEESAETDDEEKIKEQHKKRKLAEKQKKKQEKLEQERELERQQYVRPWDKEKYDVHNSNSTNESESSTEPEWKYKPERVLMSQEEWNEQKRKERKAEFAPVPEPSTVRVNRTNFTSMPPPPPPPMTAAAGDYGMMPPPLPLNTFVPYQSTKHDKQSFQRRSYTAPNEAADDDSYEVHNGVGRGAAIPPPTDLDAHLKSPPPAKKPKSSIELERSIEAGLRFLRDSCDKGTLTTKSSWMAKADY